jgi:hypothetical protein
MNITIVDIDLTNAASVEHAVDNLRAFAALAPSVLRATQSVTLIVPTDEVVAAGSDNPLAIYGKTTRAFLEVMLARIEKHGSTTLEDAATDAHISLDTARAYLRNAGRSAGAHKVSLPVAPTWDHEKGRNDYVASTT